MQTSYRPENGESGLSNEGADSVPTPGIFGLEEPPLVLCCQSHLRHQQKITDKNSIPLRIGQSCLLLLC